MIHSTPSVEPETTPPAPLDRRVSVRHLCNIEALSRPLESPDTIRWGATLEDISCGGVALRLCYPFPPGAFLAVDVRPGQLAARTLLLRVVHVQDQSDGTWLVGCEFANPLSEGELAALL
jgi:hypothetical protein